MFTRLHHNQQGTISILSVFAVLLLTMVLGMVMNVGRQVNGKIRMQNGADAAAYSGGVVLARGMNTLTFTNHLLCDVFATTAWLREARDRNAESYAPSILDAWSKEGKVLAKSGFPKFDALGSAIEQEAPLQQNLTKSFGEWSKAVSDAVLPLMEQILAEELIPQYQRAVAAAFPDIAQQAAMEVALRHGEPDYGRGQMLGALWRSSGQLVGGEGELTEPTLPVVDPELGTQPHQSQYVSTARNQRRVLASQYLRQWNDQTLSFFDRYGKMSQFGRLWRAFTCGYLQKLLDEEYADRNLPFVIRTEANTTSANNDPMLDQFYTFVGVVYWKKLPEFAPKVFTNPIEPAASDSLAYAQVRLLVPRPRLVWMQKGGGTPAPSPIGGVPTNIETLPQDAQPGDGSGAVQWIVGREPVAADWTLLEQRWSCQLVPATLSAIPAILQTVPPLPAFAGKNITLPALGNLTSQDLEKISTH